jgi:hypothetical protein
MDLIVIAEMLFIGQLQDRAVIERPTAEILDIMPPGDPQYPDIHRGEWIGMSKGNGRQPGVSDRLGHRSEIVRVYELHRLRDRPGFIQQ